MKKQIAVFICAISFDNQRRIVEGICKCAKEKDANVFIFTSHINYGESEQNKQGAYNIMTLPDLSKFDGAILVKNSIQYEKAANNLVHKILNSGIRSVSIDEEVEGMDYVGISSYHAQRTAVEHLLKKHNCKKINYVSGQTSNMEGMERLRAYRDVMHDNKLFFNEDNIFFGNYDIESGRKAVLKFLQNPNTVPEAIVCANDSMAVGVIEQLKEMNYRVPEDVKVTGFDNDDVSQYYDPSITSINRRQFEIGYRAVELLFQTSWSYEKCILDTSLMERESCGCEEEHAYSLEQLKSQYIQRDIIIQKASDSLRNMSIDLTGQESVSGLYEALKKYVVNSDMQSFYLCMCEESEAFGIGKLDNDDKIDINSTNSDYTYEVSIPLAYENGKFLAYPKFPAGEVLPEECRNKKEKAQYIITPVYYQNICFGYCVSENSYFAFKSELFYSWVLNIGIGLENIRKWMLLSQMVYKLNNMWAYDMLTHLYNRAGFFYYANRLVRKYKKIDCQMLLIFLDLDGLKQVNDNLGHEQGDTYICAMAKILKRYNSDDAIVMRYGGDEFVILKICREDTQDEKKIINAIRKKIDLYNGREKEKFTLEASIGSVKYPINGKRKIEDLIEDADQKMYEEKRKRKMKRK